MDYYRQHRMYHCLLILTDGCIHDLRETVDRIVECAEYPLSIIIVGIGDANFAAMETLDSDDYDLVDGMGQTAKRDIAQFVRLNDFKEEGPDGRIVTNVEKLAEDVLAEVPDQLVGYMQAQDIKPDDDPMDKQAQSKEDGSDEEEKQGELGSK